MRKITFDTACEILFYLIGIISLLLVFTTTFNSKAEEQNTRDLSYEQYCDSVWSDNPDYYLDVVCTTDKYQDYIETNGKWWD